MEQRLGSSSQQVLANPVQGGHGLTTQERRSVDRSAAIPGWGSDLDAARRPGVPRDKAPEIGVEYLYPPFEQQQPPFKIHKSTEHGKLTPVFGTSCPPRGISGAIRDFAYTLSEGRLMHWMALMLADRVNVVEDVVGEIGRGRVPNVPKEMGLRTELRYNAVGFAAKTAVALACTAALVVAWRMSRLRR